MNNSCICFNLQLIEDEIMPDECDGDLYACEVYSAYFASMGTGLFLDVANSPFSHIIALDLLFRVSARDGELLICQQLDQQEALLIPGVHDRLIQLLPDISDLPWYEYSSATPTVSVDLSTNAQYETLH